MKAAAWSKVALALALASTAAIAQVKVGVIASATGPTAVVGIPQKNTAALLPKKIGDLTVEYIVFDDASDSTQTVLSVKKLLPGVEHRRADRAVGLAQRGRRRPVPGRDRHADAGAGRHDGGRAADGRQEALGVQDHAERRAHLRARSSRTW